MSNNCVPLASAKFVLATLLVTAAAGCSKTYKAPERSTDIIDVEQQSSTIAVPISTDLRGLSATLEREIPKKLWSINKPDQVCAASKKVDLALFKLKTPTIKCRIVGQVTRGKMTISGSGKNIIVTMPLHAVVRAKDVAGILKQETATGDARIRAVVRLDMASDWTPKANVDISYDWTKEPGIDFLGQRITFTDRADTKLQSVTAQLEKTLPRELAKLQFRQEVESAWSQAFTSLELNRKNPSVWMQITPQALNYGGYSVQQGRLILQMGLIAKTRTFVGDRPANAKVTPLPPLKPLTEEKGKIRFTIPVIADYKELEPVILKALKKRSNRPFEIPGIGPVQARFGKVKAYGTTNGRIAVGVTFSAEDPRGAIGKANGTVWLTGRPVNPANTREVSFDDLEVGGVTDNSGTDLLIKLANAPGLTSTIADSLTQNFAKDYDDLLSNIGRAMEQKREGDFIIKAKIDQIRTGSLKATGQGLYLPVYGEGSASLVFDLP